MTTCYLATEFLSRQFVALVLYWIKLSQSSSRVQVLHFSPLLRALRTRVLSALEISVVPSSAFEAQLTAENLCLQCLPHLHKRWSFWWSHKNISSEYLQCTARQKDSPITSCPEAFRFLLIRWRCFLLFLSLTLDLFVVSGCRGTSVIPGFLRLLRHQGCCHGCQVKLRSL